jgi:hypothetical protein
MKLGDLNTNELALELGKMSSERGCAAAEIIARGGSNENYIIEMVAAQIFLDLSRILLSFETPKEPSNDE